MKLFFHVESREVPKSSFDMGMPPTTDKVWLHTGVIVCGCDIQSEPHESEPPQNQTPNYTGGMESL